LKSKSSAAVACLRFDGGHDEPIVKLFAATAVSDSEGLRVLVDLLVEKARSGARPKASYTKEHLPLRDGTWNSGATW